MVNVRVVSVHWRTFIADGTPITETAIVALTAHRICFLCVKGVTTSAITMKVGFHASLDYVAFCM